jgi:hypothetical protein
LTQLDSGAAGGILGDQQLIVILARTLQREGRLHVEAPVAAHGPLDVVDDREASMVEVQPQRARHRQAIVVGVGESAAAFHDVEPRGLVHAEGRILTPLGRHVRLHGIDAIGAGGRGHAQRVVGRETPDFLARPPGPAVRPRERGRDSRAACGEHHLVAAGTQLHAQTAVALETRGEITAQRQRRESIRQRAPQHHLARTTCDVEPDTRQ